MMAGIRPWATREHGLVLRDFLVYLEGSYIEPQDSWNEKNVAHTAWHQSCRGKKKKEGGGEDHVGWPWSGVRDITSFAALARMALLGVPLSLGRDQPTCYLELPNR